MEKISERISTEAKRLVPHGISTDKWIDVYNEKFLYLVCIECASFCRSKHDKAAIFRHFNISVPPDVLNPSEGEGCD
jgi:hypothetical protein